MPLDLSETLSSESITSRDIIQYDADLIEQDIIVEWLTLNYALKDCNPVDYVQFYTKYDTKQSFTISKEHVSSFIPNHFKEVMIRIFVRDASLARKAQIAFRSFLRTLNQSLILDNQMSTKSLDPIQTPLLDELNNVFFTFEA